MAKYGALQIECDGDTLTVRAKNGVTRWLGALFVGAGLGLMIAAANPHIVHMSRPWLVLLCAVFLVGCGVFLLVPQRHHHHIRFTVPPGRLQHKHLEPSAENGTLRFRGHRGHRPE